MAIQGKDVPNHVLPCKHKEETWLGTRRFLVSRTILKKLAPYVKWCDLYRADKHTHRHTYSEETEESLFHFSVVLSYIFLGSKIGGFQYVDTVEIVLWPNTVQSNVLVNRMIGRQDGWCDICNLFSAFPGRDLITCYTG